MGRGDVARLYHRETANVRGPRRRPHAVPDFLPMDPANQPEPFKRYPGLTAQRLPDRLPPDGRRAVDALSGRAGAAAGPFDPEMLARLLFYSAGVTRVTGRRGARTYFRAAPSAGNLHPLETYVVSASTGGGSLDGGVYHFAPDVFGLERLRDGDHRRVLADAAAAPAVANDPAALVVTGIPWRTAWKYAERGWRHLYWDAGSMLANLLAVADAHGVEAQVLLGFRDAALCELLGVDGVSEFPLAVVRLRPPEGATTPPADAPQRLPELRHATTPVAPEPIEFPLITDAQRAGDLDDAEDVETWREAARRAGLPEAARAPEPPAGASDESIDEVILRRGSTRMMRHETVRSDLLRWAMAAAARYVPSDAVAAGQAGSPGSTLLTHELSVHGVEGVEPGLYQWTDGELARRSAGSRASEASEESEEDARARATHLCLGQPLGGDSAYTLFASCDLDRVLDAYGDRGYRAAQLEAGLVAGRLQLAAFALGCGGTGLTFFDDEVSAAFGTRAACMLVTSVGVPGYRSKRGGEPGRPAELTGFGSRTARFVGGIGRAHR